ncbi:DUF1189 domain-containing protein [Enterococcus sp. DIV0242_7C1]|uniref:DUF1189 domain-containing protein n=1 Tax=Candidatus Enterococcus dunnyi TaxID=1834192 RepID=A0A200IV98_9ENTE|nr:MULTISPECIES: DUF1189 domain-containing protein [unclassified Enterococcus]MBO0471108.1 DUF1189 domain-containing protein [Enterococcus sp. DIV0242_7C1]OUZ28499.1 hypothetical protein A5889_003254 [Enterococcus sp. 9D6_DIV0238]
MNTFTLFKHAFFQFSELHKAKNMPFWKVILYILFLSVILAFPLTKQIFSMVQDIKNDGQKIAEKLPDFTIADGRLKTDPSTKGFIYQTNSIIFTFDPEGKRSLSDITSDSVGNAVSVGFLDDEFVVSLPSSGTADALFGTSQFEVPYSQGTLDGLNSQDLQQALDESNVPFWLKLIVFVVTLYPAFINLIINLLLITIGANLYSKVRLYKLRFLDCLKIVVYCSTLPVIVSSLLQLLVRPFDDSFLIILVSLMLFFFATRKEARQEPPTI